MKPNEKSILADHRPVRCRVPQPGDSRLPDCHLTLFSEDRSGSLFPLELLILATILRDHGHPVTLQDDQQTDFAPPSPATGEAVIVYAPLLREQAARRAIAEERQAGKTVLLAGPLARLSPAADWPDVEAVLDGEPETVLEPLIPSSGPTPGKMDPFPSRAGIPDRALLPAGYELTPLELGRGCRYSCRFCPTPRLHPGPRRLKPVPLLREELEQFARIRPGRLVQITDDDLLDHPETARALFSCCDEQQIPFIGKTRLDSLIRFGPELLPASLQSLNVVVRERPEDSLAEETIRDCFRRLIRCRIRCELTLLAGFPTDTAETLNQLLTILTDLPVAKYCLIPVTPLPGISAPLTGRDPDRSELLAMCFQQCGFTRTDWERFLTEAEQRLRTTAMKAIKNSIL